MMHTHTHTEHPIISIEIYHFIQRLFWMPDDTTHKKSTAKEDIKSDDTNRMREKERELD